MVLVFEQKKTIPLPHYWCSERTLESIEYETQNFYNFILSYATYITSREQSLRISNDH